VIIFDLINNELNIFYQKDKKIYYDLVSRYLNIVMNDFEIENYKELFICKNLNNIPPINLFFKLKTFKNWTIHIISLNQ
jgi:hypothetical protein